MKFNISAKGTGHDEASALRSLLADAAKAPATEDAPKVRRTNPKMRRDVDYKALRAKRKKWSEFERPAPGTAGA